MSEIAKGARLRDVVAYYAKHPEQLAEMVAAQESGVAVHHYLSTACLHELHDYCQSQVGFDGAKRPGRCKFCDAPCVCSCHGP